MSLHDHDDECDIPGCQGSHGIEASISGDIGRVGWSVVAVMPGPPDDPSPSFAYTVGLLETHGHPELIMVGFDPRLMHQLLNTAGEQIGKGVRFHDMSTSDEVIIDYPVTMRAIPEAVAQKWATFAVSRHEDMLHGREFGLLQMFLPDRHGRFPWHPYCDKGLADGQSALLPRPGSLH